MSRLPMSARPVKLLRGTHHDGSELYVSAPYPDLGDVVTLRLRVGEDVAARSVHLRSTVDGDQRFTPCEQEGTSPWWSVTVRMVNARLGYRFLIDAGQGAWTLDAAGLHAVEVTDAHDFRLTVDPAPPRWAREAVFYEIFPDRFASSGDTGAAEVPAWAVPTRWEEPVAHGTPNGVRQLYGGDLNGVVEHLDHLVDLGVSAIYLTPVFPGTSNHRYDASTFGHVDPLLGGDRALRELTEAAHEKGVRVVGDLTLNHTGDSHEWFAAATADPDSVEAGFYLFSDHPHAYETFAVVSTMPKLDHRDPELRRRLFEGPDSVVNRYLTNPGIDGWRIDVAQSAGHCGPSDRTLDTARATVASARAARPDAYVVAEHQYDASDALAGDGWHGTMTYAAFTRPVWSWLGEEDTDRYWGVPVGHPPYTGQAMARVMDAFNARVPWRSRVHSLNLLDSHDTPRLLSVVGRERYVVALGMMMTMPGIPMIFAGDEIGTEGVDLEEGRQPFRWDSATWDHDLLALHRQLIRLRRHHRALVDGSFRWLHTGDDVVVFERATREETILVHAARRAHGPLVCDVEAVDLLGSRHLAPGDTFPHEQAGVGVWRTATGTGTYRG